MGRLPISLHMAEESGTEKKASLGKWMGLAFAVVNLAVLGAGSYLVYVSTLGFQPPAATEQQLDREIDQFRKSLQGAPVIYTMDSFTTNLDGVPRRLVRVKINLEMLDAEGFEEVINKAPEARDAIMRILNAKSFSDIETVQGKLQLKNQIIASINGFLKRGVVKNVYFSQFAVQ